jgi:hypothetical protein
MCHKLSKKLLLLDTVMKPTNVYKHLRVLIITQGDQKVSVHLMITIQKSCAQRCFDHPALYIYIYSIPLTCFGQTCGHNREGALQRIYHKTF